MHIHNISNIEGINIPRSGAEMKKILAVTTNPAVIQTVRAACTKYAVYFDAEFCSETEEAESFINYELPEIKVLDFTSSDIDCHKIIKITITIKMEMIPFI